MDREHGKKWKGATENEVEDGSRHWWSRVGYRSSFASSPTEGLENQSVA